MRLKQSSELQIVRFVSMNIASKKLISKLFVRHSPRDKRQNEKKKKINGLITLNIFPLFRRGSSHERRRKSFEMSFLFAIFKFFTTNYLHQ